jgi:transposase
MQGRKDLTPKMMYQVHIGDLVPNDNFYRILDKELKLTYLYKATRHYYGDEGQESIDPVVFFKICLIGYLNNINSDRRLIDYCSDSLAIRLYLKYDIDENLPWHSTISRTRQLYGKEVFLSLFKEVLRLCVEKGMVSGRRQATDSAFIKANASIESLLEKEVLEDAEKYAEELVENSEHGIYQTVTSEKKKQIEQRQTSQAKRSKDIPGADREKAKLLSNATHYSPADPDARISTKPGKPRNLNYSGQLSVDTSHHVITGACADFADKRDSQCLEKLCDQTLENLEENELRIDELLADTGYSSGTALAYLEQNAINAWIPNFGQFTPEREGFIYNKELDRYECQRGNRAILPFKNASTDRKGYTRHCYRSSESVCKNCEHKIECCGEKTKFKKIERSEHHDIYMKNHEKRTKHERYATRMSRLRSSTVEPVLGTLINFMGMKRVNTKGIDGAEKHVLLASLCYNLQKLLKFKPRKLELMAIKMPVMIEKIAKKFSYTFFAYTGLFSDEIRKYYFLKNSSPKIALVHTGRFVE